MIRRSRAVLQVPDWQSAMADALREPADLLDYLQLPQSLLAGALDATREFPLRVPRAYADLMQPGNPEDPLLLQVLPLGMELVPASGFCDDPVGDSAASRQPGLLEKYHQRSLWIASAVCPVHCRYCFRRHFPYADHSASADNWRQAIDRIKQSGTRELILSGGDPLSLSNERLGRLLRDIESCDQIQRLRIHSRFPVVLPCRIDEALLELFQGFSGKIILVTHANHPNELGRDFAKAMQGLASTGLVLYNQSVLLNKINDDASTLAQLSDRLFETGVQPYYLHQIDRVRGAAHFEVPLDRARIIYRELLGRLPGYMVPRWVQEVPGKGFKVPLDV